MEDFTRTRKNIRDIREKDTQLQLSLDMNVSNSAISMYETGHRRIPPDIANSYKERADPKQKSPKFVLDYIHEATGGSFAPMLDGPALNKERTARILKTIEELKEILIAADELPITKHPDYLSNFERDAIEEFLQECAEGVTALTFTMAGLVEDYKISWIETWNRHLRELISKNYLRNEA